MNGNLDVFICPTDTKDNIKEAGEKLFLMLYCGKSSDSLADLRYAKYMKMVSESVTIKPETLPPTASAAAFHVYRAFYQTQGWNTLMETTLDPTDWGRILENDYMVPVMTDMGPAPYELLNVIRCNCNVSTKNQCSCRSNGLKCVAACGSCRGTECQNCIPIIDCKDHERNILVHDRDGYDNLFENLFS